MLHQSLLQLTPDVRALQVRTEVVKLIMNPRELAVRLEKGWVMRDSLVQQIGRLREVPLVALSGAKAPGQNEISGAAIKIESGDIGGRGALDS